MKNIMEVISKAILLQLCMQNVSSKHQKLLDQYLCSLPTDSSKNCPELLSELLGRLLLLGSFYFLKFVVLGLLGFFCFVFYIKSIPAYGVLLHYELYNT